MSIQVSKVTEEQKKYTVYPPPEYIFNAFNCCSFQDVKVVILGQDPYHGTFSFLPRCLRARILSLAFLALFLKLIQR